MLLLPPPLSFPNGLYLSPFNRLLKRALGDLDARERKKMKEAPRFAHYNGVAPMQQQASFSSRLSENAFAVGAKTAHFMTRV